ncbi:uncharacterized protein LOC133038266 [Cannabis sativa]|uniref:uncharacterized protein LOC133038266 n=1 Tax=Cannabis sativa TaxID=3483 RepID=UPI0029CA2CDE|nr:uncharacterized protein LOC133038266 [Cannabis sativa]
MAKTQSKRGGKLKSDSKKLKKDGNRAGHMEMKSQINLPDEDRKVKIDLEDIEDEINYWKPSLVCYVLGSNPPLHILEGFAKRKWSEKVDKVKLLAYGVFLIRFHSIEQRDEVLNGGHIFFNRKPVIMKPWDPNSSVKKEDVKLVPIWIQLEGLELKYWGEKSLFKIVRQLGKPIMVDAITVGNTTVTVQYEWKPSVCQHCYGMGHVTAECKKKTQAKKEWVVKADNRAEPRKNTQDEDGFQPVSKGKKIRMQEDPVETEIQNVFSILDGTGEEQQEEQETEIGAIQINTRGGGGEIPLLEMDKFLCWNVRGANNTQKQRAIKQLIHNQGVGFVGLLETRVKVHKLGTLYLNVFEGWCFSTNIAWHRGGRIVIAWNPVRYIVDIIKCTSQLMHLKISTMDHTFSSFATIIYAFNNKARRETLWKDLAALATMESWFLMGDFNDILLKEERIGHKVKYYPDIAFANCVEQCRLEDVKATGNFFTWSNKQQGKDRICSKIDRVMANQAWLDQYLTAEANFLSEGTFDHSPCVLSLYSRRVEGRSVGMWSSYLNFSNKVQDVWNNRVYGTKMYQVISKLKALKPVLKEINKDGFSDMHTAVQRAQGDLENVQQQLQQDPLDIEMIDRELAARTKLIRVQQDYSTFLQQKAKVTWIQNGDLNTAIFHASIKQRARHNQIFSIENQLGSRIIDPNLISTAFVDYYKELLGTSMANRRTVLKKIVSRGNKALGPDGFSSFFFQDCWEIVGDDIFQAVTSFLESGNLLKEINATILTLVPKKKCPNTVKDFRPIACCNVIYKIATKLLCSRIKLILPNLVSLNQGGFIKGRFIGHNIMICQDLLRHYGRKNNKPSCIIKLDLQKAYDTIEWDFIEEMLQGLLFPPKFIKLVMNCVRTPHFSLMFNGTLHGYFESKRGLRQGDPMSPLLFVLGMEYLTRIMGRIGDKEDFYYHDRCAATSLNHLAFADDVLLFCNGDLKSVYYLLQGLKLFSETSGLNPNATKSAMYTCNMPEDQVRRIKAISGFQHQSLPFTYLGVPIGAKRISGKECEILAEKMTARIKVWSSRNLSFAGRVVLINSVLMAIHSYWCQVMILPKKVVSNIEAICRNFLWNAKAEYHGPGAIAWDFICQPKVAGGIGFKDIGSWNKAAMGKYIWAIANKEDSLWMRWINSVYLHNGDWWAYETSSQTSWYWRCLLRLKDQFKMSNQPMMLQQYTISTGYKLLVQNPPKLQWTRQVWSRLNAPKHCFILWLAMHQRLKTRDRLFKMKIITDTTCIFCCDRSETAEHLFFACPNTLIYLQDIKSWLGMRTMHTNLPNIIKWLGRLKESKFKLLVFTAAVAGLVYTVWQLRNRKLWTKEEKSSSLDFSCMETSCKRSNSLMERIKTEYKIVLFMAGIKTQYKRIPPYERTAPTQLFHQRAKTFATYDKKDLGVGGLVTTENYWKAKLILGHQLVEDSNLSKVICPNVRVPAAEKTFRDEIIATAEEKYREYLDWKAQEKAYTKAQAAAGRPRRVGSPVERRTQAAVGRPLRIGSPVEKRAPRPRPTVQVPNTGALDASTSGSAANPMEAILATLAGAHSRDASLPPTSSQMAFTHSCFLFQLAAEAGRLSKNIINHGFVLSEFGGIDKVVKILQDLSAERRSLQEEVARQEALAKAKFEEEAKQREAQAEAMIREEVLRRDRLEVKHREALRAEGEAVAKAKRELREAREALDEMAARVKSLEELHQADLESRANLAVELKELKDFKDQSLKKAKKDELLSLISCSRCI